MDILSKPYQYKIIESAKTIVKYLVENIPETQDGVSLEANYFDYSDNEFNDALSYLEKRKVIILYDPNRKDLNPITIIWPELNKWYRIWVKEEILCCKDLMLDTELHEVVYGKIRHQFTPTSYRYKLLLLLLENKGRLVDYPTIGEKVLGIENKDWHDGDKERIYELVKDLKRILQIPKNNKNIFTGRGGYMFTDDK